MFGGGLHGTWTAAAIAAAIALSACGDDGGGGTAGGPAEPGKLGERCGAGRCETGLICSPGGAFANVCTVGCTTDQSCLLLSPGVPARCFGQVNAQCGLPCDAADDCPEGMMCGQVAGAMACVAM
jgi:hypothetical protein